MKKQSRVYTSVLRDHFSENRQMAFITGPRQVGKTTTCRELANIYLDWDNEDHRQIILNGPAATADYAGITRLSERMPLIVFDEIHKYRRWKQFLKGFFDTYEDRVRVMVTGSSRLDIYRRGGDSLMGRYFIYHMHPISVAELCRTDSSDAVISPPLSISENRWLALYEHGGFPEPFTRCSNRFTLRWHRLRNRQLFTEDVRDLTNIQEIDQLVILGKLLEERSGYQLIYRSLAKQVRISENTARSWVGSLCMLNYGFLVRPWFRNLSKALRKEPKWYLRDWSGIRDEGRRAETFCACHLLKAVDAWNDLGLGIFELRYIRDTQKREVDFLVIRDDVPWFLVEAKHAETTLTSALHYFYKQLGCSHAFQVVMDLDYEEADCFAQKTYPLTVPAKTFFSQLF